jgi:hypothetical protein
MHSVVKNGMFVQRKQVSIHRLFGYCLPFEEHRAFLYPYTTSEVQGRSKENTIHSVSLDIYYTWQSLLHFDNQNISGGIIIIKLQLFTRKEKKKKRKKLPLLPPTPTHSIYGHETPPCSCRDSQPPTHQTTSSTRSPKSTPWLQGCSPHHGVPAPPQQRQEEKNQPGNLKDQREAQR